MVNLFLSPRHIGIEKALVWLTRNFTKTALLLPPIFACLIELQLVIFDILRVKLELSRRCHLISVFAWQPGRIPQLRHEHNIVSAQVIIYTSIEK